jgi:hypothetical protein
MHILIALALAAALICFWPLVLGLAVVAILFFGGLAIASAPTHFGPAAIPVVLAVCAVVYWLACAPPRKPQPKRKPGEAPEYWPPLAKKGWKRHYAGRTGY